MTSDMDTGIGMLIDKIESLGLGRSVSYVGSVEGEAKTRLLESADAYLAHAAGGHPVAVPMVDMHTIGAGGGSIARVDAGGEDDGAARDRQLLVDRLPGDGIHGAARPAVAAGHAGLHRQTGRSAALRR